MTTDTPPRQDSNVGRALIRDTDSVPGKITGQAGANYMVEWQDGSVTPIAAATLAAADAAHAAALVSRNPRERARALRKDLDAIRAGVDVRRPGSMADEVIARMQKGATAYKPKSQMTYDEHVQAVRADTPPVAPAKPAAPAQSSFRDGVEANYRRLTGKPATAPAAAPAPRVEGSDRAGSDGFKSGVERHLTAIVGGRSKT